MNNDLTAFEKIPVKVFNTSEQGSVYVANEIASLIRTRQKEGKARCAGIGYRINTHAFVCRADQAPQARAEL